MSAQALAAVTLLGVMLSAVPSAQESRTPASGAAPVTDESPRILKRSILPDGTTQIAYSDGTVRTVGGPEAHSSVSGAPADGERASDIAPVAPPEWLTDAETNRAFLDSVREYYVYRASGLRYRSRVFEWQLFSSRIIFTTVIVLVASGIVFAAIQFRAGLKRPRSASADATEIDVSAGSIKVSSPVLGVIILVISLGFFYLYLVYVYPISEIV